MTSYNIQYCPPKQKHNMYKKNLKNNLKKIVTPLDSAFHINKKNIFIIYCVFLYKDKIHMLLGHTILFQMSDSNYQLFSHILDIALCKLHNMHEKEKTT